jgi:S-adenosylmethionine decarboxylase
MIIRQLLADARACVGPLDDPDALLAALRAGATAVGAREVGHTSVRFVPHGVTAVLILAESHLLVSTWPEHRLALVDVQLCNDAMDPQVAWEAVRAVLQPGEVVVQSVERRVGGP